VIDNAVRQQDGLVSSTTTSQANISIVRVEFEYGTATAKVKENLASALASIQGTLPSEATPKILSGSFDSVPIIALGVSSKTGQNEALGKLLNDVAVPLVAAIPGVRDVTLTGTIEKRINLTLKQSVLAANGLSQQSIVSALQANGFVLPAGTLDDKDGSISIESGTPVNSLKDFENLPLIGTKTTTTTTQPQIPSNLLGQLGGLSGLTGGSTGSFGGLTGGTSSGFKIPTGTSTTTTSTTALRIKDVATVKYENAPITNIARVNGKQALSISIVKTQDANTVAVSHAVEKLIPDLQKKLGDVEITTVFDQAPYVEKSLENLTTEGLLGLGFAIAVILLFLMSVRSTIVTAISIPTSVLITFIGLNTFGYSLNLLTLSALTIAIGRVVDDSIVVIENINRHLSYGEPKKKAILRSVREVAGAITAATITTVAVFLPIALVSGLVGELFRPFSWTFTIALIASLFVSLTIVPVLAFWFLKAPAQLEFESETAAAKHANEVREAEEARERKSLLQRGYLPILTWTQKRPKLTILASVLVLFLTFGLVPSLKTDFIGNSGSNSFVLNQTLNPGATLADKDAAAAKVEKILLDRKEVKVVTTTIGSTGDGRVAFGAAAGGTSLQVTTEDGVDQAALQTSLEAAFAKDASLGTVKFSSGGGPAFGSSNTIDIKVTASTDQALNQGILAIEKAMKGTKDVSEITNSLAEKQRTLKITVDRMAAAKKGLTEFAVSGIVASSMKPSSIGKVNINNVETAIYVTKTDIPQTVAEVKSIKIPTATGSVRLDSIADVTLASVPVSITTEKGDRSAKVMLTPDGKNLGAITADVTSRLAKVELPAGVSASIGGISQSQADSFSQLGTALLAAVAIVFIVMVATFRSIAQPLILLISIPFAATGAFTLLLATDTALGVPSLIGMLLLVGIVVTNAIVLIDLINQYRRDGRPTQEAIMDGARQRLRPILMTALATIFALTPMALGVTGGGGFISQPLAIVVIGGLFSSTILTLVIVPVLYWLVEGRKERKAARKAAKAAATPA
ncbi:MAG: efflux RND transporter permease subunit, partial [Actinomycetales bacterium]|nr:efflux RND transporter permease subunit [Actinomycetales bacterium]